MTGGFHHRRPSGTSVARRDGAAAATVRLAATAGPSEALLIGAGLGALGAVISILR